MQMPDLDSLYQDIILDHYKKPRNNKLLEQPDIAGEGFNPFCGDQVEFTARLDAGGHIHDVGFHGQGCAISQASASMMGQVLKGRSLEEAEAMAELFKSMMQGKKLTDEQEESLEDLAALEGVKKFPVRIKCALLAWSTLQDAINEYKKTHKD